MWTMLAGVPGKLKTLLDRLTAGRAANLDNLNATISSRAPASTALSNTVWTDGLASNLAQPGLLGSVKSVQTGFVSSSSLSAGSGEDLQFVNVTISAVTTGKCIVSFVGGAGTSVPSAVWPANDGYYVTARLTSSTQLRLSCARSASNLVGRWQVIEFY